MAMWLIKSVNCSVGTLEIGGKSIPIKPLVEKVIEAPSGPIPVELSRDVDLSLKNKFIVKGRGQPVHITIPQILMENTKDDFTISFMLVALCVYLAHMANLSVNRDYLGALSNVKKISNMNWCEHIVDFLIQGFSDFKTNKKHNVYVRGCVHILNVIFMDRVASYSAPQGIPHILHVTTAHVLAIKLLAVNKSSGEIDCDSIQIKAIENTVYCDEMTCRDGDSQLGKPSEGVLVVDVDEGDMKGQDGQTSHFLNENEKFSQGTKCDEPSALDNLVTRMNQRLKHRRAEIINHCMQ